MWYFCGISQIKLPGKHALKETDRTFWNIPFSESTPFLNWSIVTLDPGAVCLWFGWEESRVWEEVVAQPSL